MKRALGCSRVIAWNSVVRKNDKDIKVKDVPRQQAPEKGFIPTTRMQPPAGMAHVDQDAVSQSRSPVGSRSTHQHRSGATSLWAKQLANLPMNSRER
jgi:hypothetical protein